MANGYFYDTESIYVDTITGNESEGGCCNSYIKWSSVWVSGNIHQLTLTVYGERTDGYSATLWGYLTVNETRTSLGVQNYPDTDNPNFPPVTITVETDDSGKLLTSVHTSIGFNSSSNSEDHYSKANLTGLQLDAPQKSITIDTPDGITCSVDKSTVIVGDQIIISVTIIGLQWGDYTLSVTGANRVSDATYEVTGDVYIVVTGVLSNHTIYITKKGGVSVVVTDDITGEVYTDGSQIQHYSNITIMCKMSAGYEFSSLIVNGESYDLGVSIEVTSDVVITANANPLGLVYIYAGNSFRPFHVFIYTGTEWIMCIPYVYDGVSWNICV